MFRIQAMAAAAVLAVTSPAAFALTPDPATPEATTPAPAADAAPAAPTQTQAVTDAEVMSFAHASVEIENIRSGADTSAGINEQTAAEIRASLDRHNLTLERYNELVAAVQTDTALAARVAAARTSATATNPG